MIKHEGTMMVTDGQNREDLQSAYEFEKFRLKLSRYTKPW